MKPRLTKEEKNQILELYKTEKIINIANLFNRSRKTIENIIYKALPRKNLGADLVGRRFGKLLVIELLSERKNSQKYWKCLCDCGKEKNMRSGSLLAANVKSCGCNQKESISTSYKNISGSWFSGIRNNAKNRKIDFDLTIEYLDNLLKKQNFQCKLSGLPLILIMGTRQSQTTASLDRIDSNKGYVEGNVQFVHKHINYMKWSHNEEYFLELCKRITDFNRKI
jgi:hypothetical protein